MSVDVGIVQVAVTVTSYRKLIASKSLSFVASHSHWCCKLKI